MPRLIDLDQTVIFTSTDETQGGMQYEMQMTVAEVFDKFFVSFPEIVDAIPVEWLREKCVTHPTTDAEILHNSVIRAVLVMWEREQEAR